VRDTCFPRHFQALGNVITYDGKTNPRIWLEHYCLECREGGANDDLFIIQFLPIYLANSTRAWLDHLSRNVINSLDDLREIFTSNFQGMYMCPSNPWDLKGCQKSWVNPSEITSGVSHKNALSFLVWPTSMSSRRSGMARRAAPWFMSLVVSN
jgi:hypothetical protein